MEFVEIPDISMPLPWQGEDWLQLSRQLDSGQLPHALLLAGPRHIGKSRLVLALARLLLCESPGSGFNCGRCHACALSGSGSHGDFRWLQPEEKSRVIKIDQVREVVDFSNKTAGLGKRKVVVLAPADRMNSNAANALLKSLEEPAADTYLLLVCHRLHGVPATIRSRCQIRKLAVPDRDQSLAWLDQFTGDRHASEQLLGLAEGRPLLAEYLYRDDGTETLTALRLCLQGLLDGRVSAAEATTALVEVGAEEFLEQLATELRAMLRDMPQARLAASAGRAGFRLLDEVLRLQRTVNAGANPNRQLLLEATLGKVQRMLGENPHGGSIRTEQGDVRS